MAESLIRHDLYLAEIFRRFGPQIDEAFGPFLASLRRSYFSPEQVACLEQTLVGLGAAAEPKPKASSKGTTRTTTRRDSAATRTACPPPELARQMRIRPLKSSASLALSGSTQV